MPKSGFNAAEYKSAPKRVFTLSGPLRAQMKEVVEQATSPDLEDPGIVRPPSYTNRDLLEGEEGALISLSLEEFEEVERAGSFSGVASRPATGTQYALPSPKFAFEQNPGARTLLYLVGFRRAREFKSGYPTQRAALVPDTVGYLQSILVAEGQHSKSGMEEAVKIWAEQNKAINGLDGGIQADLVVRVGAGNYEHSSAALLTAMNTGRTLGTA